jgi:3-methyl-2-oxobutanoate hydroxymethyltransferase
MIEPRVTTREIRGWKGTKKIVVLTCYDFPVARILDRCGIDILLVGDSLGNVVLGYGSTIPVTLDEMIHHARAVMRAHPRAFVVVDMPFGTFQVSAEKTIASAVRILKETGADAVKLEGGTRNRAAIVAMTEAGIPVMGHLGLTPQSVLQMGGYHVQGRGSAGDRLIEEAKELAAAGCFAIVLESIPAGLAARVTAAVPIPTIGIGAGPACDGQVLVLHDMLGLYEEFRPRFVKRFAEIGEAIESAVRDYKREVEGGTFPGPEHSFSDPKPVKKGKPPRPSARKKGRKG